MLEFLVLTEFFPVPPEVVCRAWLDSKEHSAFTGSQASIDPRPGGRFSAWDGYIQGVTLELEASRRIVQSWRTTDFAAEEGDSRLELLFEPEGAGTRLTLRHSDIPEGQGIEYGQGWIDHYFAPMKKHFGMSRRGTRPLRR